MMAEISTALEEPYMAHDMDGKKQDLLIISQWERRKEFCVYVKFLFKPEEDLARDGVICGNFRLDCKD